MTVSPAVPDADLNELIHAVMIDRKPDLRSPYGLYDYPWMLNLFEKDGVTTAIRPATIQSRVHFELKEGPGICWGRHRCGAWISGDQHRSGTFTDFIEKILEPALADGATLCDAAPEAPAPTIEEEFAP